MLIMFEQSIQQKSASHVPFKGLCSLSPIANKSDVCVRPGFYCFVQFNTEDKLLYLIPLVNGNSSHSFLTKLALKLNPEILKMSNLLSAGEIIIGENNAIVAWCLKSGTYHNKLLLNDKELPKKTGLPVKAFYPLKVWENWFTPYLVEENILRVKIQLDSQNLIGTLDSVLQVKI
jgi:hypothetical protein